MQFLIDNKASIMLALGILLMILFLTRIGMRTWRKRAKETAASPKPRSHLHARSHADAQQPLMDAPPELLRWQVEMHETARDLKAELDTKIAILERLIIDANAAAQRLETAMQRAESENKR